MPSQDLKIKITVDGKTGELKVTRAELNALTGASDKAAESVDRLSNRFKLMGHAAAKEFETCGRQYCRRA
ncbi:hypothetical protein FACS189487_02670 [Campylobacterota bacterium]|nr:hypothetical protein FACS189487_02670 [Campylobacterota bacterium]